MTFIYILVLWTISLCSSFIIVPGIGRRGAFAPHLGSKGQLSTSELHANPVTKEGSSYDRSSISEEESFQWFDEALLFVRGGSGGAGASTFKLGKDRQHGPPSGGSGGDGGNVIFEADRSLNTLLGFRGRESIRAEPGEAGSADYCNGKKGPDSLVQVPMGSVVYCNTTGEVLGELTKHQQQLVVAVGGQGGRGNGALSTKGQGGKNGAATPPKGGDKKWLKLELRLVADIGLVGVPNAGKSTLLDAITNARPKIANYPFTTIVPNLGVCQVGGGEAMGGATMVVCDIPGLLEGAHEGVGLGRGFLRHVERCKIIVHIVNGDSVDPVGDFEAINRELRLFSPTLASKPQVVVLNKVDLPHVKDRVESLKEGLREHMTHSRLLVVSAAARQGVHDLVTRTHAFLQKVKENDAQGSEST